VVVWCGNEKERVWTDLPAKVASNSGPAWSNQARSWSLEQMGVDGLSPMRVKEAGR
jgi:hypothetical protein